MTRPAPTPIRWRLHYEGRCYESQILDEKYRLWKWPALPPSKDRYCLKDLTLGRHEIVMFHEGASALLRRLSRRHKDMPEVCAALASITSDEDWREINDQTHT